MLNDFPILGVKVGFWTKPWREAAFSRNSPFPNQSQLSGSPPRTIPCPSPHKGYEQLGLGGCVHGGDIEGTAYPAPLRPPAQPMLNSVTFSLSLDDCSTLAQEILELLLFSCSVVSDSAIPWTAACQPSLSFTISWCLLKLTSIEWMMPSNHLILCRPLLLLPSIFPSIRVFSNELALHIRWPKYCSFSIGPSNEYSGLISFRNSVTFCLSLDLSFNMGSGNVGASALCHMLGSQMGTETVNTSPRSGVSISPIPTRVAICSSVTALLISPSSGMKREVMEKLERAEENVHPRLPVPNWLLGASRKGGFEERTPA